MPVIIGRRKLIAALGGVAAWPLVVRAQQSGPVIGFMHMGASGPFSYTVPGFRDGLKQFGYVEGQNVAIEYRWANNEAGRLPALAADLVNRQVAVIAAIAGALPGLAAKAATTTIPIVFMCGTDPVQAGLVSSLNRPSGNVTGVAFRTTELLPKRLDFLHDLLPRATTIGLLAADQRAPGAPEQLSNALAAASALGRQLVVAEARSESDIESAYATFVGRQVAAVVVGSSPLFDSHRDKLVALAARNKIPAIYQDRQYVLDGGLMSYGANFVAATRLAGRYVGQIIKGAKPADLPVEQPTQFELIINMKTAKTLGLDVPPILLIRADELIE
jgi:putative tryptophan/tyrosine transport system substrate-binding protein